MNCIVIQDLNRHLNQLDADSVLAEQEVRIAEDIKCKYDRLSAWAIIEDYMGEEETYSILNPLSRIATCDADEREEYIYQLKNVLDTILEKAALKQAKKEIADGIHDNVDDDDYLETCA